MPFDWKGLLGGVAKGALGGSPFGLPGAVVGGVTGGVTGAFGKDIDKKLTGNSQSGMTQNLLNVAGLAGGGSTLGKALGSSGGFNPLKQLGSMFGGGGSGANITSAMFPGGGNPQFLSPSQLQYQNSMLPGGGFGFGGSGGSGGTSQESSVSSKLGSLIKNPLLQGIGTMIGSQFIRSPKVPELPQSVVDFQNTLKQGNPLQNQASQALMQQLSQTQQNLGQPEIDAINRQYDLAQEQELKSVDAMYKSLRPGTDPMTDTAYQKDLARVRDRYATLRADSVANAQRQISNDFATQRAQQITQAAGLSNQQLQQLATLSQYDLDRQLSQLNIDYADKQVLRDYILQLGGNIVASNYQQRNPFADLFGGNE